MIKTSGAAFAALLLLLVGFHLWAQTFFASEPSTVREFFLQTLAATGCGNQFWRPLAAPWFHKDLLHLSGNVLGLGVFGYLLKRASPRLSILPLLFVSAWAGMVVHQVYGNSSLGISGGVYAFAGALVALGLQDPKAPWSAGLGWLWLGLGALGSVGDPSIDTFSHILGAALGFFGVWVMPRSSARISWIFLALALLGPLFALKNQEKAQVKTVRAIPMLKTSPKLLELVRESVQWQKKRRDAISQILAAAKEDKSLAPWTDAFRKTLDMPPAVQRLGKTLRESFSQFAEVPGWSSYRHDLKNLLPVLPPQDLSGGDPLTVDATTKKSWEELLAYGKARDKAIEAGAQAWKNWRTELLGLKE